MFTHTLEVTQSLHCFFWFGTPLAPPILVLDKRLNVQLSHSCSLVNTEGGSVSQISLVLNHMTELHVIYGKCE